MYHYGMEQVGYHTQSRVRYTDPCHNVAPFSPAREEGRRAEREHVGEERRGRGAQRGGGGGVHHEHGPGRVEQRERLQQRGVVECGDDGLRDGRPDQDVDLCMAFYAVIGCHGLPLLRGSHHNHAGIAVISRRNASGAPDEPGG